MGGGGDDTLSGGTGADTLDGGEGNDAYIVDATDSVHDSGNGGTDRVVTNLSFTLAAGSGIEFLSTKADATRNVSLTGDEGANRIIANGGDNTLMGLAGDDTILGDAGDDKLTGGLGRDTLTGGDDTDTFVFGAADSSASVFDTITDFVTGVDKIDLSTVGAGGLTAAAFAEVAINSNSFTALLNAAATEMADGDKSAVFVSGSTHGWLFWNTDATPQTPDAGLRLNGLNTLDLFQRTDII
jgi:Ca2+-binding RTX toxin-like protein